MHILFISHYFYPEGNAPATRVYEMTRRWVQAGHRVTVLTGVPNVPNGVAYKGYRNRWCQHETIEGVDVVRVWTYLAPNKGTIRRTLNYLSFMMAAAFAGRRMRRRGQRSGVRGQPPSLGSFGAPRRAEREGQSGVGDESSVSLTDSDNLQSSLFNIQSPPPDLVIATSPQFFCGWAGAHVAKALGVPFILEVRDLWPESIKTVGAITRPGVIRFLEGLEQKLYARADRVVTVGGGYRDQLVKRGVYAEKISIIPNGVDRRTFSPREADAGLRAHYKLGDAFVCAYVGTIGMAAGLDVVLGAAVQLKAAGRTDIRFLLVGDGAERAALQRQAERGAPGNVVFTGRLDKSLIPAILASSDACLVHLRKADLFRHVLPSKMYEAAAMARPIILGVEGDAAELVRETGAGVCIEPGNPRQLGEALMALADDRERALELGRNGAEKLAPRFDSEVLAAEYLRVIETVYSNRTYSSRIL